MCVCVCESVSTSLQQNGADEISMLSGELEHIEQMGAKWERAESTALMSPIGTWEPLKWMQEVEGRNDRRGERKRRRRCVGRDKALDSGV